MPATLWDARRRKIKGAAPRRPTSCIHCKGKLTVRYLYCTAECSEASREAIRQERSGG